MLPESFSNTSDSASAYENARLLEIVSAANAGSKTDELAVYCLERLNLIIPFQVGFFLVCEPEALRLTLPHARHVPSEIQQELLALEMGQEFFATLDQPEALAPLIECVRHILTLREFTAPLIAPLRSGQSSLGLLVLAGAPQPAVQADWAGFHARRDFLIRVGAHVGTALKRIRAHEKLRSEEKWLREFLNRVEDGYWQTDGQGRITLVNEAALRTLKRPREQVLGKRIDELSDADPEGLHALRLQMRRDGFVRDFILRVRASDGEIRTIRETLHLAVNASGQVTGMQGIFRDITDQTATLNELQQRRHELELLHELATRLNNSIDTREALNAGLEHIIALTHAQAIGIILINQGEGHYELVAQRGVEPALVDAYDRGSIDRAIYKPGFDPESTDDLIEYLVVTRRILTTEQIRAMTPRFNTQPIFEMGYQSLVIFPICFDTHVYGVVALGSKKAQQFDANDIRLVEHISAQLGLALHNKKIVEDLQRQVQQVEAVVRTGRILQAAPRADEGLPRVVREIRRALGASYVVLHLLRADYFEYVTASDTRETRTTFPIREYEHRLLETPAPLIVDDCDAFTVDPEQRAILKNLGMRAAFGVRLYAGDHTLGLLFVNQETPRVWQAQEAQLILAFSHQIAHALENKRLLDEVNQQVRELKTLAQVGRLIATASSPDDALYAVAAEVVQVFQADYVSFHLREGTTMRLVAESHDMGAPRTLPILSYQYRILEELDPVRVTDVNQDAVHPIQRQHLNKHHIVADLGVPLVAGQKAQGILYICQFVARAWTDAEVQLAETFAQQIAGALTHARLLYESQAQVRDLRALARSAQLIAHSRSPENALPQAARDLRGVLGAHYVGFHLMKDDHFHIVTEPEHGFTDTKYPVQSYHIPTLHYFQKIITRDRDYDAKDEKHRANLAHYNMRADVGVPMVSRGKTIGILFVSQKEARDWQPGEIQLIETYAHQIATVLENVQLLNEKEARVHELAQLSELTELTTTILDEKVLEEMAFSALQNFLNAHRITLVLVRDGKLLPARTSDGIVYPLQPPPRTNSMDDVFRSKRPLIVDPQHPAPPDADVLERMRFYRTRSMLVVPLVTAAEAIGLLTFAFTSEHLFTDAEVRLAQSATNQLAMAFSNARLVRDQQTRIEKLNRLSEFSLWCGTLRESKTLVENAAPRIRAMLDATASSIRLVEGDTLGIGASAGYRNPAARDHAIKINPSLHRILYQQHPMTVSDLEREPTDSSHWRERHLQEGFRSVLMMPMIAEGRVTGILTLFYPTVRTWDESEIRYAQTIANTLALALANVHQIENVKHHSDELRATLDSVFSGVFATDTKGNILSWNRAAQEITGFDAGTMLGKPWHTQGPRVGAQQRDDTLVLEAMEGGQVCFSLVPRFFTRADGRIIQLREAAAPLRDIGGQVRGAVCAFWDRTQEQAAERAQVDFINLVGHQLNNKLGAMIWSAQQLGRAGLSARNRERLIEIIAATLRDLQAFNKRFNEFQREHMHEAIQDSEVDLRTLLQVKLTQWRTTAPTHRFRVRGELDRVLADPVRLNVVLDNLLENAVKYSPAQSWITVGRKYTKPDELVLTIHNAGEPIAPELRARLFERWQRGESAQPGSGLGLWLVRTQLHEMGGDIRVESRARRGTTFFVTLRRRLPPLLPPPMDSDTLQIQAGDAP